MRLRLLAAGGLAAILGGVLAVAVAAHTDRFPSDIDITAGVSTPYVYGDLDSQRPSCEPDRKVKLFRKRSGEDQLIDSTRSIANSGAGATWTIESQSAFPSGKYYSKARRRDLAPGPAHSHICQGDTSDEIPLGP